MVQQIQTTVTQVDRSLLNTPSTSAQTAIAITATFTTEPIQDSLEFWLQELGLPFEIQFAPYNQVFQQLLDPTSLLSQNQAGINVVLIRLEDWIRTEANITYESLRHKIERNATDLVTALQNAVSRSQTPYLVFLCPASPNTTANRELAQFFSEMETFITQAVAKIEGIYVTTAAELNRFYPVPNYYDAPADQLGHIPFTSSYFTVLGTAIARKIYTLKMSPHKVIVLDCDQTLWQGVCGEDGPLGIAIDPPRRALQEFMVKQAQQGMLICLCSKNVEEDVIAVYDQRTDMPLTRSHIVAWRINWQPKSQNIKSLAQELNLGLDSFIFIDDNPVECSEVQANCPEVLTLRLPTEVATIPQFLNHVWVFDHLRVTESDQQRTTLYKQNVERDRLRQQSLGFAEFLASLELNIQISPMQSPHLPRVAQLTQRTNQFNATTIRRSEAEIQQFCQVTGNRCLVVEVSDRFGDYGLVGVILSQATAEALEVDTFLLSCRVLGRGVEHQMMVQLGELAQAQGLTQVNVPYVPSQKNQPILDFLEAVGSQFKQPISAGYSFSFLVDYAKSLTYKPNNAEQTPQSERKLTALNSTLSHAKGDEVSQSVRWHRIAQELREPEQILRSIEARSQRQRPENQVSFVAPGSETEKILCDIWTKALHLESVGIHDNYFELGGSSLLAVSIFTNIATIFAKNLPITTLIAAPTIAQLATILERSQDHDNQCWPSLVPLRSTGYKTPLFFVHGGFGDVLGLTNLAKHIDPAYPFYGLRGIGLDGIQDLPNTIPEIAARYLTEIRAVQPHGPYFLGGQCSGGTIAYEMAQQLQAEGEEVALLALLDTPHPQLENYFATRYRFYQSNRALLYRKKEPLFYIFHLIYYRWKINYHLQQLLQQKSIKQLDYILSYCQKGLRQLSNKFGCQQTPNVQTNSARSQATVKMSNQRSNSKQPVTQPPAKLQAIEAQNALVKQHFFERLIHALQAYQPQPYDGKIDFFLPTLNSYTATAYPHQPQSFFPHLKPVHTFPKLLFGWDDLARQGMAIHEFESTHIGMIREPSVQALATSLNACLDAYPCHC
jgi:FkbH-like protein